MVINSRSLRPERSIAFGGEENGVLFDDCSAVLPAGWLVGCRARGFTVSVTALDSCATGVKQTHEFAFLDIKSVKSLEMPTH